MEDKDYQKALGLEARKQYVEAAELWEALGQIDKAIFNYQRGKAVKRAIDLALKKGLKKKAAEIYLASSIYDKAAEIYRQERDYVAAARALKQGGLVQDAAAMFEKGEAWVEAAKLWESINDFMKAGELYDKGGDVANAARVYELAIDSRALDRLGGKKEMSRVAAVLTKVKNFEKAAQIYVQSEEITEAVVTFVRMGEIDGAAKLYADCQADVGFEILARVDPADKSALDFARMFYVARDYEKAGRVFESLNQFAKAALLFEKNRDYHHAADMYVRADDNARAAAMYEKAGDYREAGGFYVRAADGLRAAGCFELAGEVFDAGRFYHEAGRMDKAVELLQKVSESDGRYVEASGIIAEIFRKKGLVDLAIERYRKILTGARCDPTTVEYFYDLGCILMEKYDLDQAEALLADVIKFKFSYKDAAQRLDQVRVLKLSGLAEPVPAATESPALPADAEVASALGASGAASDPGHHMITRMDGFDVLRQTALFEDLSLAEMRRFWDICEIRFAAKGDEVLADGAEGEGLFLIKRGSVDVAKNTGLEVEILVRLHPGEYFGEMALIDPGSKTSAAIVAAEEAEFFFLRREEFLRLLAGNDATALKMQRVFIKTLCQRLRRSSDELVAARARTNS